MIDLSPEEFRRLGYKAIDLITAQLAGHADAPVRQPVPADLRESLMHPDVSAPVSPDALLDFVAEKVFPYPMGNNSPRFFGWVNSPAAPMGILAELLAAAHNPSVAGGDHSATYIEHGVLNWLKSVFGFPEAAGGLLTSGGSVANLVGLAVMRHVKAGGNIRAEGFTTQAAPMVVYTSSQGHSCIQKAVELLGIGSAYLRKIPALPDYTMDMDALKEAILADRFAGLNPVCVVASAGTVNSGAVDPIEAIADLCAAENLWLHVDGAYGGVGILAEPERFRGLDRADSIAVDPHKWLYMPVECGCTLVKDQAAMRATFSLVPPYLRDDTALPWFSEFGIQQSRAFKALKLWLVLHQIGEAGYRQLIAQDIAMTRYLVEQIEARPDFELLAYGGLSIACFRYTPADVPASEHEALNRALLKRVQESGEAFLIGTELEGVFALRACIVNFRTTEADIQRLLEAIVSAGQAILMASPLSA